MNSVKKQYIAPQVKKLSIIEVAQQIELQIKRDKSYLPVPALVLKTN